MTNPVSVDILAHLNTQGTVVEGTDAFAGKEPADLDNVVTIYDTGGLDGHDRLALDNPTFQVRSKNSSYADGYDILDQIKNELISLSKSSINESTYIGIWGVGDIQFLTRDENDRCIFTMNFRCVRTPKDKGNRV